MSPRTICESSCELRDRRGSGVAPTWRGASAWAFLQAEGACRRWREERSRAAHEPTATDGGARRGGTRHRPCRPGTHPPAGSIAREAHAVNTAVQIGTTVLSGCRGGPGRRACAVGWRGRHHAESRRSRHALRTGGSEHVPDDTEQLPAQIATVSHEGRGQPTNRNASALRCSFSRRCCCACAELSSKAQSSF